MIGRAHLLPMTPPRLARPALPMECGRTVVLLLMVLVLAACSRKPQAPVALRLELGATDGPRTPEGARLRGVVAVTVAAGGTAAIPDATALEASTRAAVVEAVEAALRQGHGAPPDRTTLPALLGPALARRALRLVSVEGCDLALPGDDVRRALQPTTDTRILLVGLDGFDWDIADPLMAAGRMPALSGLVARGARARLLRPSAADARPAACSPAAGGA